MAKHEHHLAAVHDDSDDSDSSSGDPSARAADGSRPPPKKRNRAALSCTLCRERKVKCDRVIPCQQCIKRGDAEYCHLDPNKRGPQSNPKFGQAKRQSHQHAHREHGQYTDTSAMTTTSDASSPNEVIAIKARLAQLEQALAQQQQGSAGHSPSFSIPSSTGFSPAGMNSSAQGPSSRPSWATANSNGSNSFTAIPANQFAPSQRSSSGSLSQQSPPSSRLPGYFSQQGIEDGLMGRTSMVNSQSPSNGGNSFALPGFQTSDRSKHRGGSFDHNGTPPSSISSGTGFSLPTLQALATQSAVETDKSSNHTGSTHRGEVDSDTEDAALVLEGLAMNAGRGECDKKSKRDLIEQPLPKSIQAFVEDDKTKDIMSEGRYQHPGKTAITDKQQKSAMADRGALPLSGPSGEQCNAGQIDADCEMLAELLKADPDAEFGPDGKRIPPSKRVCILLSRHKNSLFNLVYGPETFLGWGMGWAFAAAEAAGDMMKVTDIAGCKGVLQREAVLRAIIRSLPDRQSAEHLVDIFDKRIKFLTGNCVHMPTFKKEMAAFYDLETVEKRAREINFVDPGWLSVFLMILVHALHFHPCERPDAVMHFFDGRTVHLWRSAAQTSLVLARYQSSTSMAVLQALILINLYTMCIGKGNYALKNVAITNAIEMGLHRLGSKEQQPKPGESSSISIRRELAKRMWYYLVICDWCSATENRGMYRIHPSQFNTPIPGNYNDSDLCISPLPEPHPTAVHTEMSFVNAQIQLATVIRENVDMQNLSQQENRLSCSDSAFLDGRYRGLLEQAPSFYRVGSDEGENENTEVERWLYQQFIFDKLLRLHRPNLSSKTGARTSCVLLARSILDMQRRIRSRCSIVDRLFMKLCQSFSAAIVLCLDLLQTPPRAAMRDIVRGEVFEAVQALRHVGATHHATGNHVRVIEALLEEEEARWKQMGEKHDGAMRKPSGPLKKKNLLNLALRVAKATQSEEPFKPTICEEGEKGSTDVAMSGVQGVDATQSHKDEQSRQLMEQLLMGKPSFDEPSSFSLAPFQTNTSGQPSTLFAANQLDLSQSFPSYNDETNNQPFDLSKFLAECDTNSSPGSVGSGNINEGGLNSGASDSGHSSLHGGRRTNSTSSVGRMSHSSSQSHLGNSSENHSPINAFKGIDGNPSVGYVPSQGLSPNAVETSTGLDGFWNWILAQGSIPAVNADKPQAPLGQIPSSQTQSQSSDFNPSTSSNSHSLNGQRKTQSEEISAASAFSPLAGNAQMNGINTTNDAVFSLGTPSAGIGSAWMNTPGLFDFALESGNDGSSNATNTGFPSLSAPQQATNSAVYWS